jgi:hypothetical protein
MRTFKCSVTASTFVLGILAVPEAVAPRDARVAAAATASPSTATSASAQPTAAPAALAPSNGTGCAPGTRCIKVTRNGRPRSSGTSIAQCRGKFPDFIVPANTIPSGFTGPWFSPEPIENASNSAGVPTGPRPWESFDPEVAAQRVPYLLALRNYAFASAPVRALTPALTNDSDYFDSTGGSVPADQKSQTWYPAPRMIYGTPSSVGGSREASHGLTQERRVSAGELASNTAGFANYAVAYYDARGAGTFARVWSTATAGVDTPVRPEMKFAEGAMVYKLLFSAAKSSDFPTDILAGSLGIDIRPNAGGAALRVRLLQIDIAVKDKRAGPTGWYFATFAYDRGIAGSSPWLKMSPVGFMFGNDPDGTPIKASFINPSAVAYAKSHLGVQGRLNGPVDNRASACMSCHSTAQAPSLASILPPTSGSPCFSQRAKWFRDLPGTEAFGRFEPSGSSCLTSLNGITLTAADYSLQLGKTVTMAVPPSDPTFNPCTFDTANPPAAPPSPAPPAGPTAGPAAKAKPPRVFPVAR